VVASNYRTATGSGSSLEPSHEKIRRRRDGSDAGHGQGRRNGNENGHGHGNGQGNENNYGNGHGHVNGQVLNILRACK
jgi:hypothetical protein